MSQMKPTVHCERPRSLFFWRDGDIRLVSFFVPVLLTLFNKGVYGPLLVQLSRKTKLFFAYGYISRMNGAINMKFSTKVSCITEVKKSKQNGGGYYGYLMSL